MNALSPSFNDFLGDAASFRFVNGPFKVTASEAPADITRAFGPVSEEREYYQWWKGHRMGQLDRVYPHDGIEQSVEKLGKFWKDEGPFDGIVGFSQGAALASIIAMGVMIGDKRFKDFKGLRLLVAFSGWPVKGGPYADLFDTSVPTYLAFPVAAYVTAGASGKDSGRASSEELAAIFSERRRADGQAKDNPGVVSEWHTSGHIIPRPTEALLSLLKELGPRQPETRDCYCH